MQGTIDSTPTPYIRTPQRHANTFSPHYIAYMRRPLYELRENKSISLHFPASTFSPHYEPIAVAPTASISCGSEGYVRLRILLVAFIDEMLLPCLTGNHFSVCARRTSALVR
jgi:hypothetical protein